MGAVEREGAKPLSRMLASRRRAWSWASQSAGTVTEAAVVTWTRARPRCSFSSVSWTLLAGAAVAGAFDAADAAAELAAHRRGHLGAAGLAVGLGVAEGPVEHGEGAAFADGRGHQDAGEGIP